MPYGLKANRIFVLSKEIQEENSVIDTDTILNYDQNPEVGSIVNLYGFRGTIWEPNPLINIVPWMDGRWKTGFVVIYFHRGTTYP